ncbi:MAG: hypothetical protein Q4P66_00755 [Actinomycetaceae bacterium]|nr:hypothetical protein [Actinomycetaceae bacterium]
MTRKHAVVAAIVAVILCVGGALVVFGNSLFSPSEKPAQSAQTSPTHAPTASVTAPSPKKTPSSSETSHSPQQTRSTEEIKEATTTLSKVADNPEEVVAQSSLELYGVDLQQVFPKGTVIDVDEKSWTDIDETTAMVATTITRPGKKSEQYSALLGKSPQGWKLLGTLPLSEEQSEVNR